jgi:membrane-bound acyltransferase YfiQ involved in biofilm formation
MKMNKQNLDERQVSVKNKIGSQSFLLLAFLLFADAGLYSFGVRWLPYPANIIVILTACLFVFLVRTIHANAYAAPGQAKKNPYLVIAAIGTAIAVAAVVVFLSGKNAGSNIPSEDNGAMILFIVSIVMIVVVGVVAVARRKQG